MSSILAACSLVRRYWRIALGVAVAAALAVWRAALIGEGRRRERADQAERNRRTREDADAARDAALASGDPRRDLLREFRRPDGG